MKTKMKQIKEKTTKGNLLLSVLMAVVAIVFAACTSDIVISDVDDSQADNAKVIGFKSYSEKITRAATDLEFYHNTFVVYGTKQSKNDLTDIQYVFGGKATNPGNQDGVTCTYEAAPTTVTGYWKYDNPRYWDKQADYDFIAYAPANAPLRYYYNAADAQVGDALNDFVTSVGGYTLTGTNLQVNAASNEIVQGFTETKDLDLMISDSNGQDGNAHDDEVNLVFKHILSKLNVTFAKDLSVLDNSTVTLKSVEIEGLKDKGVFSKNNTVTGVSGWTAEVVNNTYKLAYPVDPGAENEKVLAGAALYFIESLVIPQAIADDQVTLTAKYTIQTGGYSEDYTYKLDMYDVVALRTFNGANNYTLKFTIAPDVIKFDASVTLWTDQAAIDETIE